MLNSKSDDEGKKNYLICIILRNGIAFMSNRVILKNFYKHRYFKTRPSGAFFQVVSPIFSFVWSALV